MIASELIKKLQEIIYKHGNLDVDIFTTRAGYEYNEDHADKAVSINVETRQEPPYPRVIVIHGSEY